MRILAFESSAKAASVALLEDDTLLAEQYANNGKTQSAILMPMAEQMLRDCGLTAGDLSLIAVARGPGSFTGVRIGVAAAKGMAWAAEKEVCGVSTLEAMARGLAHLSGILCPVMDARRAQVYNALFASDGKTLTRMTPDRAISLQDLENELGNLKKTIFHLIFQLKIKMIFLVGDGSKLCYNSLGNRLPLVMPPAHLLMQRASWVALCARDMAQRGETEPPEALTPNYLRLSQAERERLNRLGQTEAEKLKGDM